MTDLEIYNCALIRVGCEPLTTLVGTGKAQRIYANVYASEVKKLLITHPWNFALKRTTITENGNTPDHEFTYEFDFPTDYLRIRSIEDYDGSNGGGGGHPYSFYGNNSCPGYKVENNKILANEATLKIRYVADITDASIFSVEFAEALEIKLAEKLSYTYTQSNTFRKDLLAEFQVKLDDARAFDAQSGGTPEDFQDEVFLNSRF